MKVLFASFWMVSGLLCLLLLLLVALRRPAWSGRTWRLLPAAVLAAAAAQAALYLAIPSYADYGEPTVAILASNLLLGGPVYADWRSGEALIGSNYGPYVFVVQAAALSLANTILASKLPGILAALATLGFMVAALRDAGLRGAATTLFVAIAVAFSAFHLHYWFWNRPDPMLMALVAFGAWLLGRASAERGLAALGLLAGIALNLKLFGALYLLPLAVVSVVRIGWSPRLLPPVAIGGLLFAVAVLAPFATGAVDHHAYVANILLMPGQGLQGEAILQSLALGAAVCALPAIVFARVGATAEERLLFTGLVLCTLFVAILSGKPGGGTPYLLPFIPLAVILAGRAAARRPEALTAMPAALAVVLLGAGPIWAYGVLRMARQVPGMAAARQSAADLRALYERFPGAEMALSGSGVERGPVFFRVEKGFAGQVTRFDYVNYADQALAGVPLAILHPLFEGCRVPHWIFPSGGERLTGTVYGDHAPLFDTGARQRLAANYRLVHEAGGYEVWGCRI